MEPTELRTERLLLRPWRLSDLDDVLTYATDEEWARYLPVPQPYLRRDGEEFVARVIRTPWETRPIFAIQFEERVVGGFNLHVRPELWIAELAYSISKDLWGQGLIPEAARAIID